MTLQVPMAKRRKVTTDWHPEELPRIHVLVNPEPLPEYTLLKVLQVEKRKEGRRQDGMYSKREPTHRRVVGIRNSGVNGNDGPGGLAEFELRVDLGMDTKMYRFIKGK